jgi:hypothetical protein
MFLATFEYNGRTFPYAFGDVLNVYSFPFLCTFPDIVLIEIRVWIFQGRTPGKQFVKKFQGSPYLFVKMDQCKATVYGSDLTNY